jgi:nitroreductase
MDIAVESASPPKPVIGSFPVAETIRRRYSCRTYRPEPLTSSEREELKALLASVQSGPFGEVLRFRLVAGETDDSKALRGLGTYGFISGATAFVVGAVADTPRAMEEYGYGLERVVLGATAMGLGSCWLGGTFRRSRFAAAVELGSSESLPAVIALGHPEAGSERGLFRRVIGAFDRRPWSELFFDGDFATPLEPERAGRWQAALEMIRLGPSASNRQPWRVVRERERFHLFVRRTPGYRSGLLTRVFQMADLQRVDMGIAMCHFELQAKESALPGSWRREPPRMEPPAETEYVATWQG